MSLVQRSPPTTPIEKPCTSAEQSKSETDIPQAISQNDQEFVNSRTRYKRPRVEGSPDYSATQLQGFKQEIKDMLSDWKEHQDEKLSQLIREQSTLTSRLISDLNEVKLQNIQIQRTNTEIEKSITFISAQYEDMKNQMDCLQKENQEYKTHMESLERKIQDLQYKTRSSTVEIRNIPGNDKETTEDLTKMVTEIGNTVSLSILPSEIRDIYRASGKPGTNKNIVAELTTVQKKQKLISSVRAFNAKKSTKEDKLNTTQIGMSGKKQPVYVDEHLPGSSKRLFFLAREFAKQRDYKFCWSTNGNIFLRKQQGDNQILVKSEDTLKELMKKEVQQENNELHKGKGKK